MIKVTQCSNWCLVVLTSAHGDVPPLAGGDAPPLAGGDAPPSAGDDAPPSAGGDAPPSAGDDGEMISAESADTATETADVIMDEPVDGLCVLSTYLQLITGCSFQPRVQLLRVEMKKVSCHLDSLERVCFTFPYIVTAIVYMCIIYLCVVQLLSLTLTDAAL